MQRKVINLTFSSTLDTESADLLGHAQAEDREKQIDKLLRQLGEASRQLIDAADSDAAKHTVTRGDSVVKQE